MSGTPTCGAAACICTAASTADLPFPTGAEQLLKDKYSFADPTGLFKHIGKGVFQVKHEKTFQFYHAKKTTGDKAKNRFHDAGQCAAGELWSRCNDGKSVTEFFCSASDCTSTKCPQPASGNPDGARATAHVYHAEQSNAAASIPYCMFIPTCSGCNNRGQTEREGTCWDGGSPLTAYCCCRVMFVEISDETEKGKGGGKGGGN